MTLFVPTCHLNGTSPDELFEQVADALKAIRAARRALEDAAPNARDYHPQGPDVFTLARAAHDSRDRRLKEVQLELVDILEGIDDQRADIQTQKAGRS